jgi:hypothetical protein
MVVEQSDVVTRRRNPLTAHGKRMLRRFKREYGKRGEEVFYRSARSGRITGVERNPKLLNRGGRFWLWGGAAVLALAYLSRAQGGMGSVPYGQNPAQTPTTPQLPNAAINGLLPSTTQQAFAAYPRSVALQGPNA